MSCSASEIVNGYYECYKSIKIKTVSTARQVGKNNEIKKATNQDNLLDRNIN